MQELLLRLGHSPDPDDAFMFYALAKNKIPTGRYRFQHILQDIQTLNQRALKGELEITAISIHAYPYVADQYALTSCGSSMGDQYGPMIIAQKPMKLEDLKGKKIAIPGELTTAFLAMQLCLGKGTKEINPKSEIRNSKQIQNPKSKIQNAPTQHSALSTQHYAPTQSSVLSPQSFSYEVVMFDEIPARVKSGEFDAGLIIHEGQLTYQQLGLHLIVDLGQWWHQQTQLPLPLGGNCIRKNLGPTVCQEVTDILKQSIQYSLDHRQEAVEYALQFGRDLDKNLADQFVGMYVNHWTLDYGPKGREAINLLLKRGAEAGIVPACRSIDYITAKE
jgi:1,4-dihydroxy-6-naphthoate synthase